jgi:hypothetical protein
MKRLLIAILGAAALVAPMFIWSPVWSPVWAQDASRLNQDMDARPILRSEQTVGALTPAPRVSVQQPLATPRSRPRRRPARASKTPPRFPGPPSSKQGRADEAAPATPR